MAENINDGEQAGAANAQAQVALFTPIATPILRSVDPIQVAKFFKERDRYELEIESKKAEVPTLKATPYKASVDRSLLKHLVFMGCFDDVSPGVEFEELTDNDIEKYLRSLLTNKDNTHDPTRLKEAMVGLKFPVNIRDSAARITTYCADVFERLDAIGYEDFKTENPKHTIKILLDRIKPPALKSAMFERIKVEAGLEKNVRLFIARLKEDAKACQSFGQQLQTAADMKHEDPPAGGNRRRGGGGRNPGSSGPGGGGNDDGGNPQNGKDKKPICLYPPHREKGIKHFIKDCNACPKEDKEKYLKEYLEERKQRNGKAHRVRKNDGTASPSVSIGKNPQSSILFTAVFGSKYRNQVCADNGADTNILDNATLRRIMASGVDLEVETLAQARVFDMAAVNADGASARLTCKHSVSIDTELHIRHGSTLRLRNLKWLVTDQRVTDPLLGRPILEALGLNTRELLAAAADQFCGSVDAERLIGAITDTGDGRVSRVMEGVFHADGGEDVEEDQDNDGEWCDIGDETTEEWEEALRGKLKEAEHNGLSPTGKVTLEGMIRQHRSIVRVRYNGGPPARVTPLKLHVKEGVHPVRSKPRRYPPEKRQFLRRYVSQLEKLKLVKAAIRTEWVSAPLIVPKKPPAMYRMTVDYRPINAATIKNTWPMPHIDAVLQDVRGSEAFAAIDFTSGYWQLPMDPDSQPLHSFMTPDGVMQPTRTTQGGCNSAANFQACVEPCFSELRENLLAWLDDFALHNQTEHGLLRVISRFLDICAEYRLVVSLPKSTFFAKEIRWCGRIIDATGVTMDPENYEGIRNASEPSNAAELCQYVHCAAWMSNAIPRFAERAAPLYDLLDAAYNKVGKRTKKAIARLSLKSLGWGDEHSKSFNSLQQQLQEVVKTAHRNPEMHLCVHSDASDAYWAAAVTQCDAKELLKPINEQRHEPLAFLSGQFSGAQEHWSTYEKEAFAVVQTFRRLNYLLGCSDHVTIFTDHRNLLFTFHPTAVEPSLGRHKVLKVIRWALYLSAFSYTIEHVPGELNTMADIMTRWMRGYRNSTPIPQRVSRIKIATGESLVPTVPDNQAEWPSRDEILEAQRIGSKRNSDFTSDDDGLLRINDKVWIPDEADELKMKLLIVAHAGQAGHRGGEATCASLREVFTWTGIVTDVKDFVANCLLCVLSRSGSKVPRPLATTLHATKPNNVLHFDYLFLGEGPHANKYALVVKDDFSGYCWISPTPTASSEHAAETLARWQRTFTAPVYWISDQGAHFINALMKTMADTYNIQHKPTVAYSPWVNGTIERINRDILAAMRAMLAELKLGPQDWMSVIDIIPSVINEAPQSRLGHNPDGSTRSPLQVMTGIKPRRAILQVLPTISDTNVTQTLERTTAERICKIDEIQNSLHHMHKDVDIRISDRRRRAIEAHNAATNIVTPNFEVGDFVVICKAQRPANKLSFRWCGPRRIHAVKSPAVCSVEDLVTHKLETVHVTRIKKYCGQLDGQIVPSEVLDLADRSAAKYEVVEKIVDIAENDEGIWLRLQWEGLPDERDYTWAILSDLYEDIPDMVTDFLKASAKKKESSVAALQLGISL